MPKPPRGVFRRGRSWYTRLRTAGEDRWISLGPDLRKAVRRLRELQVSGPTESQLTVGQAARVWLDTYIATARNPRNQRDARARVAKYLNPAIGKRVLDRVAPDDLRGYRLWLEGHGLSQQTVAHILSDARCLFNWCAEAGLIVKSPVPRRLLPRIQERPPNRLTDIEARTISSLDDPWGFVCRFALGTGLRWGEMIRAKPSDLQADMLVVARTKSGKVRRVPLGPHIATEIATRQGRIVPFKFSGDFARAVRAKSGVHRFHVHQMRHTFGCQWLERGGSLAALKEIMGHASIRTTLRYAQASDDMIRREAKRVNSVAATVAGVTTAQAKPLGVM